MKSVAAFCTDAAGLQYALFGASGLAALDPDRGFDIRIFGTDDLQIPDHFRGLGIGYQQLTAGSAVTRLTKDGPSFLPETAYLRLLLPEILADQYDRILYLDIDLTVLHGDIDRLIGADMLNKPIAAVRDYNQWE